MSNYISISSPFSKRMYSAFYGNGRDSGNPAAAFAFSEVVPAPLRRINTVIQNQGTTEVVIGLEETNTVAAGDAGIKLYAGQTLSLDNYNGRIWIFDSTATNSAISITESFA
jgi:hypothetical protein